MNELWESTNLPTISVYSSINVGSCQLKQNFVDATELCVSHLDAENELISTNNLFLSAIILYSDLLSNAPLLSDDSKLLHRDIKFKFHPRFFCLNFYADARDLPIIFAKILFHCIPRLSLELFFIPSPHLDHTPSFQIMCLLQMYLLYVLKIRCKLRERILFTAFLIVLHFAKAVVVP